MLKRMARAWWHGHWHWMFAVLVGVWTVFFLAPVPSVWAWFVPVIAVLGAWLLGPRPVFGAGMMLLASMVSSLSGIEFGRVELALPVMVALYVLARSDAPLWLELVLFSGLVLATSFREGADAGEIPIVALTYALPLVFGRVVTWRANTAKAAVKRAEELGAIDVARVANSAAEQERARVIHESIATLRTGLEQIRIRALRASEHPSAERISWIQDAARTVIDRLHGTLSALRASPQAAHQGARKRCQRRQLIFCVQVLVAIVVAALMLLGAEQLGLRWYRPMALVPALLIPPAVLMAPRRPLLASALGTIGLAVVAVDGAHPPEALVPLALPLAYLYWRLAQSESRQQPWALTLIALATICAAVQHGRSGIGFVLILFALGVFGGVAWADKDAVMQREEARAAKLTARLASAQIGAVRAERRRIARELHDVLSHAIAGVSLQTQVARIHLEKRPSRTLDALTTVLGIAEATVTDLENIADRLYQPATKYDLSKLVSNGANLELQVSAELDESASDDELAYRIVQEALTNAARHAPGSAVEVRVETQGARRRVWVRSGLGVSDLGTSAPGTSGLDVSGPGSSASEHGGSEHGGSAHGGLEPGAARPDAAICEIPEGSGSGLEGLSERVSEAGGSFAAGSTDAGFVVEAEWPVESPATSIPPDHGTQPGTQSTQTMREEPA